MQKSFGKVWKHLETVAGNVDEMLGHIYHTNDTSVKKVGQY